MTRRMGHDAVLKSLEMAMASPALETKLNAVIVKGLNDCEAVDFVGLTKYKPLSVRFIEFMPFTGTCSDRQATDIVFTSQKETSGIPPRWCLPPTYYSKL
jgi:molybdenum cofactor biosynthesis enzyme MoaA